MTREAVIVSTARTGLAKSGRGGFNITHGAAMAGHAVKHSIERARKNWIKSSQSEIRDALFQHRSGGSARQACWTYSKLLKLITIINNR